MDSVFEIRKRSGSLYTHSSRSFAATHCSVILHRALASIFMQGSDVTQFPVGWKDGIIHTSLIPL